MRTICCLVLVALLGCTSASRENLVALIGSQHRPQDPKGEAYSHFIASTVLERRGQFDEAMVELRKAADLDPQSLSITLQLVRGYVHNQDYQNALILAERAITLRPDSANLYIVLGEIYHQLDRYDDAVAAFQKAIELDPNNVLSYGSLVSLQENANDLVASIDIYRRLVELMPTSAGVHYQLGLSYARINDSAAARIELTKALSLKPDLPHANRLLGMIHLENNENEEAVASFQQELKINPDETRSKENLAGALARLKRYTEALDIFAELIKQDEAQSRHIVQSAYLMLRAGLYKQAGTLAQIEGAFKDGARKDPPPPISKPAPPKKTDDAEPKNEVPTANGVSIFATVLQIIAAKELGESTDSMIGVLDSLEGDLDGECSTSLGDLTYLFGKEDTGNFLIQALVPLCTQRTPSKTLDFVLARTYMALDRNPEALPVLKRALERDNKDASLHYLSAIAFDALKQLPEVENHLKAYLEVKPDDAEVLNFLGYFYADHNMKLDQAETMLKRAIKIEPENGFYLDSLGWVYYRKGDATKAVELIRKAIRVMGGDDAELRNHLGDAYLLLGDREKAISQWRRAHTLNPKLQGVKEKLDTPQAPKP